MVEATYKRKEKELKRKANLPGKLFQLRSPGLVDLSLTPPHIRREPLSWAEGQEITSARPEHISLPQDDSSPLWVSPSG